MKRSELEKALMDKSISDEDFLEMLFKHLAEEEEEARLKGESSTVPIRSFGTEEAEELTEFADRSFKQRPALFEMMRQRLIKEHEHCCCSPKHKQGM